MTEIFNSIISFYNSMPDWLKLILEMYLIPAFAINFGLDGVKTKFKKLTMKKINPWVLLISPYFLGIFYAYYKKPNDWWYAILVFGCSIGFLSFAIEWFYEKYFNKFKKEEK